MLKQNQDKRIGELHTQKKTFIFGVTNVDRVGAGGMMMVVAELDFTTPLQK